MDNVSLIAQQACRGDTRGHRSVDVTGRKHSSVDLGTRQKTKYGG